MRIQGSVRDLFSHMKMLGLATIVSSYRFDKENNSFSPVAVWWESPDAMVLSSATRDISVDEAAECVRAYLDDLIEGEEVVQRMVSVGGKDHSPLSPRIAKSFSDQEWLSYRAVRQSIIDYSEREVPLFGSLVNALGFPAYWSETLDESKGKLNLDLGASLWEMAPRNQGSEFMKNKYFKHVRACEQLSVQDIGDRIRGEVLDSRNELRNASGLRAPAHLDVLLSFVALSGIELFPTRPITVGRVGSASTAATTQRVGGRKQTFFVLPIVDRAVTLEKYSAICRNAAMYRVANETIRNSQSTALDVSIAPSRSWLLSHGVSHLAVFHRFVGGTPSCPEYYANEGDVVSV